MDVRKIASLSDMQDQRHHRQIGRAGGDDEGWSSRQRVGSSGMGSNGLKSMSQRVVGADSRRRERGGSSNDELLHSPRQLPFEQTDGMSPASETDEISDASANGGTHNITYRGRPTSRGRARRAMSMDSASATAEAVRMVSSSLRLRPAPSAEGGTISGSDRGDSPRNVANCPAPSHSALAGGHQAGRGPSREGDAGVGGPGAGFDLGSPPPRLLGPLGAWQDHAQWDQDSFSFSLQGSQQQLGHGRRVGGGLGSVEDQGALHGSASGGPASTVASSLVGPALVGVLARDVERMLEEAAEPGVTAVDRAGVLGQLRRELEARLDPQVGRLLGGWSKCQERGVGGRAAAGSRGSSGGASHGGAGEAEGDGDGDGDGEGREAASSVCGLHHYGDVLALYYWEEACSLERSLRRRGGLGGGDEDEDEDEENVGGTDGGSSGQDSGSGSVSGGGLQRDGGPVGRLLALLEDLGTSSEAPRVAAHLTHRLWLGWGREGATAESDGRSSQGGSGTEADDECRDGKRGIRHPGALGAGGAESTGEVEDSDAMGNDWRDQEGLGTPLRMGGESPREQREARGRSAAAAVVVLMRHRRAVPSRHAEGAGPVSEGKESVGHTMTDPPVDDPSPESVDAARRRLSVHVDQLSRGMGDLMWLAAEGMQGGRGEGDGDGNGGGWAASGGAAWAQPLACSLLGAVAPGAQGQAMGSGDVAGASGLAGASSMTKHDTSSQGTIDRRTSLYSLEPLGLVAGDWQQRHVLACVAARYCLLWIRICAQGGQSRSEDTGEGGESGAKGWDGGEGLVEFLRRCRWLEEEGAGEEAGGWQDGGATGVTSAIAGPGSSSSLVARTTSAGAMSTATASGEAGEAGMGRERGHLHGGPWGDDKSSLLVDDDQGSTTTWRTRHTSSDSTNAGAASPLARRAAVLVDVVCPLLLTLRSQPALLRVLRGLRGLGSIGVRGRPAHRLLSALQPLSAPGGPLYPTRPVRRAADTLQAALFPRGLLARRALHLLFRLAQPLYWPLSAAHHLRVVAVPLAGRGARSCVNFGTCGCRLAAGASSLCAREVGAPRFAAAICGTGSAWVGTARAPCASCVSRPLGHALGCPWDRDPAWVTAGLGNKGWGMAGGAGAGAGAGVGAREGSLVRRQESVTLSGGGRGQGNRAVVHTTGYPQVEDNGGGDDGGIGSVLGGSGEGRDGVFAGAVPMAGGAGAGTTSGPAPVPWIDGPMGGGTGEELQSIGAALDDASRRLGLSVEERVAAAVSGVGGGGGGVPTRGGGVPRGLERDSAEEQPSGFAASVTSACSRMAGSAMSARVPPLTPTSRTFAGRGQSGGTGGRGGQSGIRSGHWGASARSSHPSWEQHEAEADEAAEPPERSGSGHGTGGGTIRPSISTPGRPSETQWFGSESWGLWADAGPAGLKAAAAAGRAGGGLGGGQEGKGAGLLGGAMAGAKEWAWGAALEVRELAGLAVRLAAGRVV